MREKIFEIISLLGRRSSVDEWFGRPFGKIHQHFNYYLPCLLRNDCFWKTLKSIPPFMKLILFYLNKRPFAWK